MSLNTKKIFVSLGLTLLFLTGFTQENASSIRITDHKGRKIPFTIKTQRIEWVNGKINLAILSTDGKLLQLNNINESLLKDTIFRNSDIGAILITDSATFNSIKRLAPLVEIVCEAPKKGNEISIVAKGSLFYKKSSYKYTIRYNGVLPEKRFNTTFKKKLQQ